MRRHIGILIVLFTISLTLPLMAYGHGGDTTKIHSCANNASGEIKVVGANDSCGNNETALDWAVAPVVQLTCPPDSVRSGTICIDKYEASVWQTTDAGVIQKIKDGTVTLADLQAAGAIQRGVSSDDYAVAGCPISGNGCVNLYGVSIPGVMPSRFINWFRAVAAARNSGKRLPINQEWQAATLGTPDGGPCIVGGGSPGLTGTTGCVSDVGAFDMVGNLWEMVSEWWLEATLCPNWGFTDDTLCLGGAGTTPGGALSSIIRGGAFTGGGTGTAASAGPFTADLSHPAGNSDNNSNIGFRGVR